MRPAARVPLVTAMAVVTLNIWTGGPLLALWIGSRLERSARPSMLAIAVVAIALGVISFVLVRVLARLDDAYTRATGRASSVRRHVPWLRSMRGERPHADRRETALSPLEIVLVTSVVLVVVLFEVWFFFYSPSPIDQRSGRAQVVFSVAGTRTRPASSSPHGWPRGSRSPHARASAPAAT